MEKPQKKLILFMPSMDGGGVEKNLIIISNYLCKHIKNITLITYGNKFNIKFNKKINIINTGKNYEENVSKYYKYYICLKALLKEIFNNPRTAVFAFQANIYCIILSKIFNFKLIVRSNSSPSGWSKNYIKNLVFKVFLKYPESIIVNSYYFKNELKKKFKIISNVIYNPLNKREILKKSKSKLKLNFFNSKNCLKIINISRFTDQKDHITLLKAFNIIKSKINTKLLIIGYGPNEFLIKKYIKENKLDKIIKIIKYQDNPYKFLKKADLFVLSSFYEGLPNVLLEAMVLKKFIISSNCPTGPKEILNNEKYGFLFKIGDYKELSNKIVFFKKKKKILRKKTLAGYKSLDRFDYNINCNKYLLIIKKII